jgi:hypothetical protein
MTQRDRGTANLTPQLLALSGLQKLKPAANVNDKPRSGEDAEV